MIYFLILWIAGGAWMAWEFAHAIPYDEDLFYYTLKDLEERKEKEDEHIG